MVKPATWIKRLRKVQAAISYYANLDNYVEGKPGAASLLGFEADEGQVAQNVKLPWDDLYTQINDWASENQRRPEPAAGWDGSNVHTDIWARAFIAANHRVLSALSWQGFCQQGKGALCIASYWKPQGDTIKYEQQIDYVAAAALCDRLPAETFPGQQIRFALEQIDPRQGYLTVFYGQDVRLWDLKGEAPNLAPYILIFHNQGQPCSDAENLGLSGHSSLAMSTVDG